MTDISGIHGVVEQRPRRGWAQAGSQTENKREIVGWNTRPAYGSVEKESRTIGSEFGRSLSTRIGGANGEVRDSMDVVDGRGT